LAVAQQLWEAYLWRALQGVFASALLPVAASALAPIADTAERARKMAGLGAASLLGFFAAPTVSATLASRGLAAPVSSALSASAVVALGAFAVLAALFRAQAGRRLPAVTDAQHLPARFLGLNLLAYLGLGAFEVALPLAVPGPLGIDPVQVSLLFVECSLMMLVAQGALMWAAPFRGQFPKLLIASIAAYCAGLLALAYAASFGSALWGRGLGRGQFRAPAATDRVPGNPGDPGSAGRGARPADRCGQLGPGDRVDLGRCALCASGNEHLHHDRLRSGRRCVGCFAFATVAARQRPLRTGFI